METRRSALLTALLLVFSAGAWTSNGAGAALLHGYLKKDKSTTDGARMQSQVQVESLVQQQTQQQTQLQTQLQSRSQSQSKSFPSTYEGIWRCQSTVIDSQVDTVPQGHKLTSVIRFVRNNSGQVVAQWVQPGWSETQASVETYNDSDAKLERTNYYTGNDSANAWAARSQDHFTQIDDATMVAQSEVDQYIDGLYIGRYRTESVLSRMTQPEDIAAAGQAMARN